MRVKAKLELNGLNDSNGCKLASSERHPAIRSDLLAAKNTRRQPNTKYKATASNEGMAFFYASASEPREPTDK